MARFKISEKTPSVTPLSIKLIKVCVVLARYKISSMAVLTHPNIVLVGVEQNDRVAQNVDSVRILEQVRALLVVVLAEALHHAVDLLGLPGQPKTLQV